jgi:hypothetical protein
MPPHITNQRTPRASICQTPTKRILMRRDISHIHNQPGSMRHSHTNQRLSPAEPTGAPPLLLALLASLRILPIIHIMKTLHDLPLLHVNGNHHGLHLTSPVCPKLDQSEPRPAPVLSIIHTALIPGPHLREPEVLLGFSVLDYKHRTQRHDDSAARAERLDDVGDGVVPLWYLEAVHELHFVVLLEEIH